jgi:hypothetical protein
MVLMTTNLRKRKRSLIRGGQYRLECGSGGILSGFGDGDFIRLRDEFGTEWHGSAEKQYDESVRFRFRDSEGHYATGVGDNFGITLRDDRGRTWRGFVD